jgi:hypothetical protein
MASDLYKSLILGGSTKISMLIMDGLGGSPREPGGKTELQPAHTPNLDALTSQSVLGMTIPVAPGVTPGIGPGHLALFGYDLIQHEIERGVMEALGVDFDLQPDEPGSGDLIFNNALPDTSANLRRSHARWKRATCGRSFVYSVDLP